jgi:hypothetical protein
MTTFVFFENATPYSYTITDQDGHRFGLIKTNGYYSIKLNYSPTFVKKYYFRDPTNTFAMWLNVDGSIKGIEPNDLVHLEVKPEEHTTRTQIFPPPLRTSNCVPAYCFLFGPIHNKLLITPINNIYARVPPLLMYPVPDGVLRLDFHP